MPDGLVLGILFAIVIAVLGAVSPGSSARMVETKTVRYRATTIDDVERRYSAEAALFATTGWAVHSLGWDARAGRPTLVATYARYAAGDPWLEAAGWSLRSGAGARRHLAAIATAIAVPVVVSFLLEGTGVRTEVGAVAMLSAVVLGIILGMRTEGLGSRPDQWLDWVVVIFGASLGLLSVLVFVVSIALIGSPAGLYMAVVVLCAWLLLRLAIALGRVLASRSQSRA